MIISRDLLGLCSKHKYVTNGSTMGGTKAGRGVRGSVDPLAGEIFSDKFIQCESFFLV